MLDKNKAIKKISNYLSKKSHTNYLSIQLESYSNRDLYIRLDYVEKLKAYKIVWYDLQYINLRHLDYYTDMQLVSSFFANKLVELLFNIKAKPGSAIDDKILGDRVIFINKIKKDETQEYIYDRYLPIKWSALIEPLALVFSYLPRSMECYLSEMFAIFDNKVELYNSIKPIKFNLNKDNIDDLFAKEVVVLGKRLENRVTFLEKINNRYLAIVEDSKVNSVIIENVTKDFYTMSCSTEKPYLDEHIYATLKSIREKKYKNFYKVKYKNNGVNMLEDVRKGKFYLAYGIENDNLLIVSENGGLSKLPILVNGKVAFEVIEDDDNLSLSKIIENYEKIGG